MKTINYEKFISNFWIKDWWKFVRNYIMEGPKVTVNGISSQITSPVLYNIGSRLGEEIK